MDQQTQKTYPENSFGKFINVTIKESITQEIMRQACKQWDYFISDSDSEVLSLVFNIDKNLPEKILQENILQLKLFILKQQKPFNARFKTIMVEPKSGFYMFAEDIAENINNYCGWKLHLSVQINSVVQAYDCVAALLLDHFDILNFKVIDPSILEYMPNERLSCGAQFTIYLYQNNQERLEKLLRDITEKLQSAGIQPGLIPVSDRQTHYPYFSLRNDGSKIIEYYPAIHAGKNDNPYNFPRVFDYLLPNENQTFDLKEHFALFNTATDEQYARAFIASLFSLVHEYIKPEYVYILFSDKMKNINDGRSPHHVYRFLDQTSLQDICRKNQ